MSLVVRIIFFFNSPTFFSLRYILSWIPSYQGVNFGSLKQTYGGGLGILFKISTQMMHFPADCAEKSGWNLHSGVPVTFSWSCRQELEGQLTPPEPQPRLAPVPPVHFCCSPRSLPSLPPDLAVLPCLRWLMGRLCQLTGGQLGGAKC